MKRNWTHQPVTILGLSKSGIAAAEYLAPKGAQCFLSETVPASPANKGSREHLQALGVEIETGGHSARCFDHSDLVIVSPGIPPSSQILKELSLSGKTIISEVELAYQEAERPFIAVTGTNGKTTTTTLISRILENAGKTALACGNIGTPIISLVDSGADYFVAELSSFQLTFSPTLRAKVAVMMNFRPDHLDWHGSVEAYKRAKFVLFEGNHSPEWAVLNADDPVCHEIADLTDANILWFSRDPETAKAHDNWITLIKGEAVINTAERGKQRLFKVQDLKLVGAHNQENAMAAAAATWLVGTPTDAIIDAITTFEGVEHRLEPVLTLSGVTYYNDSKATNPDASLSALAAFTPQKVVLIAGGRDKKTDLQEFVEAIKAHVTHVVLIGEAADRFSLELKAAGYTNLHFASSLEDAVHQASQLASEETPVLFSPACSSFDMFRNFEERGAAFKQAVYSLQTVPSR